MKFFAVSLLVRWAAVAVFLTATAWATAQQTIQFSKPVDQDLGKANSFLQPSSKLSPGAFNAPAPVFGDRTPTVSFDTLPGAPAPATIMNSSQWQKKQDASRNWSLMTPEEILNVPTPEKILGITDPRDDPKISAEQRFLQREQQNDITAASNSLVRAERNSRNDQIQFSDANSPFGQTWGRSSADLAKKQNGLFGDWNPNVQANTDQSAVSSWSSPFGQPLPKPTPEALAGMERFRAFQALMDGTDSERAPVPRSASYQAAAASSRQQTLPTDRPTQRSPFGALEDSISRPVQLAPLDGITSSRLAKPPKSTSLVQPPPWMKDGPQTFQQRQF